MYAFRRKTSRALTRTEGLPTGKSGHSRRARPPTAVREYKKKKTIARTPSTTFTRQVSIRAGVARALGLLPGVRRARRRRGRTATVRRARTRPRGDGYNCSDTDHGRHYHGMPRGGPVDAQPDCYCAPRSFAPVLCYQQRWNSNNYGRRLTFSGPVSSRAYLLFTLRLYVTDGVRRVRRSCVARVITYSAD